MNENDIRRIVQEEMAKSSQKNQYSVNRVPVHLHNNIDSPNLPQHSITGFVGLTGTPNGVNNPALLNGQVLSFSDSNASTDYPEYGNVYTYPLPIIYGYGTTSNLTLTGTASAGATSAILTGNWGGTSGTYAVRFSSDEIRIATLTNGSTAISWSPALLTSSIDANIVVEGNARFHGGEAPYGTTIIFRNDDDGLIQLWVRTAPQTTLFSWAGVDLGGTGLYIYT